MFFIFVVCNVGYSVQAFSEISVRSSYGVEASGLAILLIRIIITVTEYLVKLYLHTRTVSKNCRIRRTGEAILRISSSLTVDFPDDTV